MFQASFEETFSYGNLTIGLFTPPHINWIINWVIWVGLADTVLDLD